MEIYREKPEDRKKNPQAKVSKNSGFEEMGLLLVKEEIIPGKGTVITDITLKEASVEEIISSLRSSVITAEPGGKIVPLYPRERDPRHRICFKIISQCSLYRSNETYPDTGEELAKAEARRLSRLHNHYYFTVREYNDDPKTKKSYHFMIARFLNGERIR